MNNLSDITESTVLGSKRQGALETGRVGEGRVAGWMHHDGNQEHATPCLAAPNHPVIDKRLLTAVTTAPTSNIYR